MRTCSCFRHQRDDGPAEIIRVPLSLAIESRRLIKVSCGKVRHNSPQFAKANLVERINFGKEEVTGLIGAGDGIRIRS